MKNIFIKTILFIFFVPQVCGAANLQDAFSSDNTAPLGNMALGAGYETDDTVDYVTLVGSIIRTLLSLLGVVFLILLLYGGFLWMTARGNEQQVEKAKDVIFTSVIGMIIILSAYAISYFVVSKLTSGALAT